MIFLSSLHSQKKLRRWSSAISTTTGIPSKLHLRFSSLPPPFLPHVRIVLPLMTIFFLQQHHRHNHLHFRLMNNLLFPVFTAARLNVMSPTQRFVARTFDKDATLKKLSAKTHHSYPGPSTSSSPSAGPSYAFVDLVRDNDDANDAAADNPAITHDHDDDFINSTQQQVIVKHFPLSSSSRELDQSARDLVREQRRRDAKKRRKQLARKVYPRPSQVLESQK